MAIFTYILVSAALVSPSLLYKELQLIESLNQANPEKATKRYQGINNTLPIQKPAIINNLAVHYRTSGKPKAALQLLELPKLQSQLSQYKQFTEDDSGKAKKPLKPIALPWCQS